MYDFFEIDFLDVETSKSGDAIVLRYAQNGRQAIHVVDGGFRETGARLLAHLDAYYGHRQVDHVVATHPDGDHCAGLASVLEGCAVGALWMMRPWRYAQELLPYFPRFANAANLAARLRECYPYVAELEEIALRRRIPIGEPLQGAQIGAFTVLAPTAARYFACVLESEKTPEAAVARAAPSALESLLKSLGEMRALIAAAWGIEYFPDEDTSAENEMSVVQFALLSGQKIVLTGDTGRAGLAEAAAYAPVAGLYLPGVDRFQVPHHGSRRNVSTEVLDRWLGRRLSAPLPPGSERTAAIISAARDDKDHLRKAVVRAMIHRGATVVTTEGRTICTSHNAPSRPGWSVVPPEPYPTEQEE